MGLLLLLAACSTPAKHASNNTLQPRTVHSPYIAASGSSQGSTHTAYHNYGLVDAQQPAAIASGPAQPSYAPAEVSPTGAHRTVIDQVTNQPIKYGEAVNH